MEIAIIIPARMSSTRFPGKPMKKINGIPMIGHCFFRAKMNSLTDLVFVATCDNEIKEYIESIGGNAIMTSSKHERASDRIAEAMLVIEEKIEKKIDIVVLFQGDEPMITPKMIDDSIQPMLNDNTVEVVNLMTKISSDEEFKDPNEVKVVTDLESNAIYFSREPIPSDKKFSKPFIKYKQVCVIPFLRKSLIDFNNTSQSNLEIIESVDMLRFIENGKKVKMIEINDIVFSVDTQSDLEKVEKLMKKDTLVKFYEK